MAELELWMRVGQPLEPVLTDLDRTLDAWQSGGVRGLVIGPVHFADGRPAFVPNPTVYRRWDVELPEAIEEPEVENRVALDRLIDIAKGRGWPVYLFNPGQSTPGEESGPSANRAALTDDPARRAYLARVEDAVTQFPAADGFILDGPAWGYEIAEGHPNGLFDGLGPEAEAAAKALGFDYARLVASRDRFQQRLHKLSREAATLGAAGGVFNALHVLGNDPGVASWLAFRQRTVTGFYRQVHQLAEALTKARGRQVKFGIGSPMPSLAPLAGFDFPSIAAMFDVILPKMFLWHRGDEGLYGTVWRYVTTLMAWNPGLWEAEAFNAVRALLGLSLPGMDPAAPAGQSMQTLREMDRGFPDAVFDGFVTDEAKRCVAAADGYAWRVLPWIAGGRSPRGGDPLTGADLRRLLPAIKNGGVRHVLFDGHSTLTPAEWAVMSEYAGYGWREGEGLHGQYRPAGA